MKQAYECGVNFFDTAERYNRDRLAGDHTANEDSYAGGQSEIVMGEAIKALGWQRSDLVISTKARCRPK